MRITIILALFCFVPFLTGCISLKSEYPNITYYRLEPNLSAGQEPGGIDGTLLIREFSISGEYDSEHLLRAESETEIQRYYYHRWIQEPASMLSDFVLNRMLSRKLFGEGVVKGGTQILPDYFLEGRVLEMVAGNASEGRSGWVRLRIHFVLVELRAGQAERRVLLQKVFSATGERADDTAASIAAAMSAAAARVTDALTKDLLALLAD